jgi:hypothetical protein
MSQSLSAASATVFAAVMLAAASARATVWDYPTLADIPPSNIGAAHYFTTDGSGSGLILSVLQDREGLGSMGGSSVPGQQGLWLGQDGLSSGYRIMFNKVISRLSISFVGLTAAGAQAERLTGLNTFTWSTIELDSPDGSAQYADGELLALSHDSRGQLSFRNAISEFGVYFTHDQPFDLGGFVITRIEASVVPEPAGTTAWLFGIAALGARAWLRRRSSDAHPPLRRAQAGGAMATEKHFASFA